MCIVWHIYSINFLEENKMKPSKKKYSIKVKQIVPAGEPQTPEVEATATEETPAKEGMGWFAKTMCWLAGAAALGTGAYVGYRKFGS